jgi:diadenosine tetraphosphatase ApaH/serine/threonine PP2A family protein phosphatase
MSQRLRIWSQFEEADRSDSDTDEDATWSESAARKLRRDTSPTRDDDSKALCDCGRPLRRFAKEPKCAALLMCGTVKICDRCGEAIDVGVMYFRCTHCPTVKVCKTCGPGVFIERKYEYVDRITDERRMMGMPGRVLHERQSSAMLWQGNLHTKSRGVELEENDVVAAKPVAEKVMAGAARLVKGLEGAPPDKYDREWEDHEDDVMLKLFGASNMADVARDFQLLNLGAREIMKGQFTVNEASVPCKVFGDLHGQARDMLLLFSTFGMPCTTECPSVVFNGDFVDRGVHQLEVLSILFALKVLHGNNVWLNRGNHEDRVMNQKYGFQRTCDAMFGEELGSTIFDAVTETFTWLPLATVIGGKVLALHGGIGDGRWSVKDLRKVKRPLWHKTLQEPQNQWLWNILWSDPIEDDANELSNKVFGVHPSPRSKAAFRFGWNVTQSFCASNGLDLVIRSHQAKKGGLGFDVMHNEMLIRVFSARDYESNYNDGAVLHISEDDSDDGANETLLVRSQVLCSVAEKLDH